MWKKCKYIIFLLLVAISIHSLAGCQVPKNKDIRVSKAQNNRLWRKLHQSFKWEHPYQHKDVKRYIAKYEKQAYHFKKLSQQATPYLYHVVAELEKNNMPGEIAIIPMVESAYRPNVISSVGASGIWQLNGPTAKRFGIKKDNWYDGRKDIEDSTKVAIKYLKFLNKEFKGDWLLTLAAYNCGEGRVKRAIRKNKKNGKPIDYWSLRLPKQTKQFVPKILAISYIIKHSEKINDKLAPVKNKPYFVKVDTKSQIDLRVAADLAEITLAELKKLNPGYLRHTTHPKGPHNLFVPKQAAATFKINLARMTKGTLVNLMPYTIQPGDSLSKIAIEYKTSVTEIKATNKLTSNVILVGNELLIPVGKINKSATAITAKASNMDNVSNL